MKTSVFALLSAALTCSLFFLNANDLADANPYPQVPTPLGCASVSYDGPAACNCTGGNASTQVCTGSSVQVEIGGSVISISISQSQQSCTEAKTAHGECVYIRYRIECCPTGGIFGGSRCRLVGTEARKTQVDC